MLGRFSQNGKKICHGEGYSIYLFRGSAPDPAKGAETNGVQWTA